MKRKKINEFETLIEESRCRATRLLRVLLAIMIVVITGFMIADIL